MTEQDRLNQLRSSARGGREVAFALSDVLAVRTVSACR